MEGSSVDDLPPSKRFKFLQHHGKAEADPHCLPAKKRIGCWHYRGPTSLCLPAKKRIWAVNPQEEDTDDPINLNRNEEQKHKNEQVVEEEAKDDDDGVVCAVCGSTDGDPSDPIVFCDGCDLMVHASCYGSPLTTSVPDGDWFCRGCEAGGGGGCGCCLCPAEGGAVKRTVDGRWAHITCALFVPEAYFRDPEGREGIDVSGVPAERRGVECCLCGCGSGCGVGCAEPDCAVGFHVSCGLREGLAIEYKEAKGVAIVAAFCRDHTLLWKKQQMTGKFKIVAKRSGSKRKVKG